MEPRVVSAADHNIPVEDISPAAIEVVETLCDAGYDAYLVGGCVRDLILGLHPKDFDVATDASPDEIKQLFRRCRLIGRRFRLAHVQVGREIIEVATFRAAPRSNGGTRIKGRVRPDTSVHGRILRDNEFGNQVEDAQRRDFTINALYFDPLLGQVLDYVGGFDDLKNKRLNIIGVPDERYREDPVRMLRALRFSAKLGFRIDASSRQCIERQAALLEHIPAARLFDEVLKLFHGGAALKTFDVLREHDFVSLLFPQLLDALNDSNGEEFIRKALQNTDDRVALGKPVIAAFLFSVFLWLPLQAGRKHCRKKGMKSAEALQQAAEEVIARQCRSVAIPRRVSEQIREIWILQHKLEQRRRVIPTLQLRRFRAAYDFLLLRAVLGEVPQSLCDWWTEIQELPYDDQAQWVRQLKRKGKNFQKEQG